MRTIYNEIELEQQREIDNMEIEIAQFTANYNGIRNYSASRMMGKNLLGLAEFLLYCIAAASFVAFIWLELVDFRLIQDGVFLSPLGREMVSLNTFGWKLLVAGLFVISLVLRWLVGRIRGKNTVILEQGDLTKDILNKLNTDLYKLKEAQKRFETMDPDKKQEKEETAIS